MEEILELQRKLADVQASSNLNKLSDRIIVDLVDRLLKTTDFRLIFTLDGQEYITPEYLEIQMKDIIQQKSRVSVIDIPQLLNVGYEKIEPRLDSVCSKFPDISRLDDFLFTGEYIDSICEEINEELQQKMHIPLVDLSSKYALPMEFVRNMLERKSGSIIQGGIDGGNLTTLSYTQTMSSKLRGILRASIRPIALSTLAKDYDLEEVNLVERIEDLIKADEIEGKIQGGMFIPIRFLRNQETIAKNFFRKNDYIEYNMLTKQLLIQKPKDYLKSLFKESCIFLENVCYNKDSLGGIKEQVETLLEFGWVDLTTILPPVLQDDEIETIIGKYLNLNETTEMEGTMIFSKEFLEKCAMAFKDKIIEFIYKTPQKLIENKESTLKASQKQTKKGKKGASVYMDDNDPKEATNEKIFSQEEVIKTLIDQKIIDRSDKDEYLEEKLYKLLIGRIGQLYEKIKKELFESKKSGSTEVILELQKRIEDLTQILQFHNKSMQMIETNFTNLDTSLFDEAALSSLRYLIENLIILLCKKYSCNIPPTLLIDKSQEKVPEKKETTENLTLNSLSPSSQIFKNLDLMINAIDFLPKDLAKLFKDVKELLIKKKLRDLVDYLVKNSDNFGFKANPTPDKKTEKNFFYLQKYLAKESIKQNRFDLRNCYFNAIIHFLVDQGYYFIAPFDEKVICILNKTLIEICADPEIKKMFSFGLEIFTKVINKENEDIYLSNVKEMESLVENLVKIIKV